LRVGAAFVGKCDAAVPQHAENKEIYVVVKICPSDPTADIGVGGMYLLGKWSQASFQKAAAAANGLADVTQRLSTDMLKARRAEKDFLLRMDAKYVKAHADVTRAIAVRFDDIASRLSVLGQSELIGKMSGARANSTAM
jgi:hypothetical protein